MTALDDRATLFDSLYFWAGVRLVLRSSVASTKPIVTKPTPVELWVVQQRKGVEYMEDLKHWLLHEQDRPFDLVARTTEHVFHLLGGTPLERDGQGGYVGVTFEEGDYINTSRHGNILSAIIPAPPEEVKMPTIHGKTVRTVKRSNCRVMFSLNAFVLDLLSEGYKWGENKP